MNIAGVLVHTRPERVNDVCANLQTIAGLEIHMTNADGRIVVTVEDVDDHRAADAVLAMHRLDGVLSASLVYHHFEPLTESDPG